ncbi:pentatricopeptide repeat-containing protein At4g21170-like, partial [Phoenix dactylifera]|uniref:Pentatricopeptide repeat-containing protein At4g21170-like n=1 Tax=Phoenix dactylifera TaxID=42345 RepID=A0A8B8ZUC7_PHODC
MSSPPPPLHPSLPLSNGATNSRQRALASQISSLLLQRKDWIPLLRPKSSLLSPLAPDLFLHILTRIQSQPEISLRFFNWAKSNLGFHPDLRSLSKMVQILVDSDLLDPAKHLLHPLLRSEPFPAVLDSILRASTCQDSRSRLLSFVLESYASLGSVANGLETFRKIRVLGCQPSTSGCNALLDALCSADRIRRRKFGAAVSLLNEMYKVNLRRGLVLIARFLMVDANLGMLGVINSMLREMVVRELLPTVPVLDYDWVIRTLCAQGKTYAAEMFFEIAQEKEIKLGKDIYLCMLRALSKEGRVEEAMRMYRIMSKEGVSVNLKCCVEFVNGICKAAQCGKARWKEASELLDLALEKGILVDASCCCTLVEHYCGKGLLDSEMRKAMNLHDEMLKVGLKPDDATYKH